MCSGSVLLRGLCEVLGLFSSLGSGRFCEGSFRFLQRWLHGLQEVLGEPSPKFKTENPGVRVGEEPLRVGSRAGQEPTRGPGASALLQAECAPCSAPCKEIPEVIKDKYHLQIL